MSTPITTASSDFVKYLTLEKAKSMDMPMYDYANSLWVWLKAFALQATFVGIAKFDDCTVQLGRFMPTTIKHWLPTQAAEICQSWILITEQLLLQFGKPADKKFREFKTQLRKCKQLQDASIRIHSAQWLHLLKFLPTNHLSDDQKIAQFTQSVYDRSLRATLVAFVEIKEIKTVDEVIAKAIDIESKAKLLYHPDLQQQIERNFEELERNGIVTKVNFTEWGSQVTAVPKPDGSVRICGNYIKLKAITTTVKYPFVNMDHALQSLALVAPNSTYVFNTMVMGTKNSPAYFQILMDKVLGPMRYTSAIAYKDDTILYSETFDQHVHDLKQLLHRFRDADLSINIKKCDFALTNIKFLGFLVTPKGIKADPEKVKPILQLVPPKDIKELERFLGMAGVYLKFISQYQVMIEPLRRLERKDTPFLREAEQEAAFQALKRQLAQLPLLKQPNFDLTFHLYCDASNTAGIAVVLCQQYNDTPYPLSFASRALTAAERNYTVRELEALPIVFGVEKHRMHLERRKFFVHTDHSSLQWLLSSNQDK